MTMSGNSITSKVFRQLLFTTNKNVKPNFTCLFGEPQASKLIADHLGSSEFHLYALKTKAVHTILTTFISPGVIVTCDNYISYWTLHSRNARPAHTPKVNWPKCQSESRFPQFRPRVWVVLASLQRYSVATQCDDPQWWYPGIHIVKKLQLIYIIVVSRCNDDV